MKKYRANDFWDRLLQQDLSVFFSNPLSIIDKKIVFKKYVEVVNMELSTQCNRHCGYCPLSNDSRGGITEYYA